MPSPSLLITQNFNSPLATQFALHLLLNSKSDGNNVAQLFALVSPLNGTKMSKCLKPFVDNGRLCVLFGNASAQKLVKEVVEKNKILSIFVLLNGQNKDDYNEEDETFSIVSETRSFLTSMCSLLECLRQCNGITTQSIVVLFHSSNAVTEDFFLPQFDNDDQQTHPIIKCKSKESALFSSLHALCHSFAVSYKMNIQIGLINQTSELIENGKAFKAFEDLASLRMEEKAKINFFELGKMIGDIETFNISRVLLFSNIYLNEQQKQEAINTLLSSQNCTTFELNKNNFIWAKTRPGNEKDEQIEGEIFDKWPSHLLLFNEDEESGILWENGGPSNLKENICSNLFSPWLLKQICSEFGICFIQFPQQNDEENQMENRRNIDISDQENMAPRRENKSTSLNLIFDPNPKQYEVDSIVNRRILANGKVEYLLKWKQHPDSEKSWEPEDNLDCPELIEKFKNFLKKIENATPMERIQSIVGAARMNNEIFYYVKYTGSEKAEFLPSRFMKKKYPLLIIEFYETRYTEDR